MMSNCPNCRGAKRVRQLGNILGDCGTCNGLGQVTLDKAVKAAKEPKIMPVESTEAFAARIEAQQSVIKDEHKTQLKLANAAYMNKPVSLESRKPVDANTPVADLKPPVALDPNVKQAPALQDGPKVIHPDDPKLAKIRSETNKDRYDPMAAQREGITDSEPDTLDLPLPEPESDKDVAKPAKGKANAKASKEATG